MYLRRGSQSSGKRVRLWLLRFFLGMLLLLCSACHNAEALKPEVLLTGLEKPRALAFDNYCRLYIAESGSGRVLALQPGTNELIVVKDGFQGLTDITIDRDNTLYVASDGNGGQRCVYSLSPAGYRNLYCDQLEGICGLSIDRHGCLLIAESGSGRVLRIRETGGVEVIRQDLPSPKRVLDIRGMLVFVCDCGLYANHPGNINGLFTQTPGTYDGIAANSKDGSLYVLDALRKRLLNFDANGSLLASFDCAQAGLDDITALACDRDGALYAATVSGDIVLLEGSAFRPPSERPSLPQQHG